MIFIYTFKGFYNLWLFQYLLQPYNVKKKICIEEPNISWDLNKYKMEK